MRHFWIQNGLLALKEDILKKPLNRFSPLLLLCRKKNYNFVLMELQRFSSYFPISYRANQWTDFYITAILFWNGLIKV